MSRRDLLKKINEQSYGIQNNDSPIEGLIDGISNVVSMSAKEITSTKGTNTEDKNIINESNKEVDNVSDLEKKCIDIGITYKPRTKTRNKQMNFRVQEDVYEDFKKICDVLDMSMSEVLIQVMESVNNKFKDK